MVGEKIKCDGSGCNITCCKGCSCCVAKNGIIQSKSDEINTLKQKILELVARPTAIGSDERLSQDNQRLRGERDYYRVISKEYKEKKEEADKLVEKLTASLTSLTEKTRRLEKDNQELKNKVEGINKQIETPSKW